MSTPRSHTSLEGEQGAELQERLFTWLRAEAGSANPDMIITLLALTLVQYSLTVTIQQSPEAVKEHLARIIDHAVDVLAGRMLPAPGPLQ